MHAAPPSISLYPNIFPEIKIFNQECNFNYDKSTINLKHIRGPIMKKWVMLISFISFTLMIGLYACSNDESGESSANQTDFEMAEDSDHGKEGFTETETEEQASVERDEPDDGSDFEESEQMIIYTGHLEVEVNDFQNMTDRIKQELSKIDGYVVESSEHAKGDDEQKSGYMVVRVPQQEFDSFMNSLETEDTNIKSRNQQSEDVTEEYVDLESRLKAKEAVEERLLQFMEQADKTEDLLKISDDLSKVQEDIEQIKGRMNYIENHVAYSTVHISIEERNIKVPDVQSQDDLNTLAKAQKLFMDTINSLLKVGSSIVVLIVGLSPILIPVSIVAIYLLLKRKRQKND